MHIITSVMSAFLSFIFSLGPVLPDLRMIDQLLYYSPEPTNTWWLWGSLQDAPQVVFGPDAQWASNPGQLF